MTHFAAIPIAFFTYDRAMRVWLDPEIGPSLPTARSLVVGSTTACTYAIPVVKRGGPWSRLTSPDMYTFRLDRLGVA